MIVGAVIGVFVANPACNLDAFTAFAIPDANGNPQYLFPILFVTIACGAVSGFHSLVSSGTASKQIKNEKNMLPVSFGAMLMESMLAILALIAVASFGKGEAAAQGLTTQPQIFAGAIANFLSVLGLPHSLVFTLINLAVSAFALTSLCLLYTSILFCNSSSDLYIPLKESPLFAPLTNPFLNGYNIVN